MLESNSAKASTKEGMPQIWCVYECEKNKEHDKTKVNAKNMDYVVIVKWGHDV